MRILITIQHPGHVHFFKNAINSLGNRGHDIRVCVRENEVATDLLDSFDIEYEILAGPSHSLWNLARIQLRYELRLLRRAKEFSPDVIAAVGGVAASHIARLTNARSIIFTDTEHATLIKALSFPFAHVICTPSCYQGRIGPKQLTYPGFHELAYLHPKWFTPDRNIRNSLGIDRTDPLVFCRFSSWDSSHDLGQGGFTDPSEVVNRIAATGAHVVVSSEIDLPDQLEPYQYRLNPAQVHDVLYTADVVVSEGATTASEAAILGTPAIYVNSLELGYTTELALRYGLLFNYHDGDRHHRALEKAIELLHHPSTDPWLEKREKLLTETIDVTEFIIRVIENRGASFEMPPTDVYEPMLQTNP